MLPRLMVTCTTLRSSTTSPAFGDELITVPDGNSESVATTAISRLSWSRLVRACASRCPVRSGTVTLRGPVPTWMVMSSVTACVLRAAGAVATTLSLRSAVEDTSIDRVLVNPRFPSSAVACANVRPRRSGTCWRSGPVETYKVTVAPLSTFTPSPGVVRVGAPTATVGLGSSRWFTRKPIRSSSAFASTADMSVTRGIDTCGVTSDAQGRSSNRLTAAITKAASTPNPANLRALRRVCESSSSSSRRWLVPLGPTRETRARGPVSISAVRSSSDITIGALGLPPASTFIRSDRISEADW